MGKSASRRRSIRGNGGAKRAKPVARRASTGKTSLQPSTKSRASTDLIDQVPLETVHTVGGKVPRGWTRHWKIDKSLLITLRVERCTERQNLYLYLQSEALDKATYGSLIRRDGDEDVPVLIAIACEVEPTTLAARFSLQNQEESFAYLSDLGLKWLQIAPRIYILKSVGGTAAFEDYAHLPIMRPSQVSSLRPEEVTNVSIAHRGVTVIAECGRFDDDVDELIEDGEIDKSDRGAVVAMLEREGTAMMEAERAKVDRKKEVFRAMVDEKSRGTVDVLGKLESMRVFKIYPKNVPKPKTSSFGAEWGFRKNAVVNRYIGSADEVF